MSSLQLAMIGAKGKMMGRDGDRIYDSEESRAAFAEIVGAVMREASFVFAPEQAQLSVSWFQETLTVVELLLLLSHVEQVEPNHLKYQGSAIQRWRETFFENWDTDWTDPYTFVAYGQPAYRAEHRSFISGLFDDLVVLAEQVEHVAWGYRTVSFPRIETLPRFSSLNFIGPDGIGRVYTSPFLAKLLASLIQRAALTLSEDNTGRASLFHLYPPDEVCVMVDVLGLLIERYQVHTWLNKTTLQQWLDVVTAIWLDDLYDRRGITMDRKTLAEQDGLYQTVVAAFDRLTSAVENAVYWPL